MIKNQVARLDKINETAWAVVDRDGWLCRDVVPSGKTFFPSRAQARQLTKFLGTPDLRVVKVKLVLDE